MVIRKPKMEGFPEAHRPISPNSMQQFEDYVNNAIDLALAPLQEQLNELGVRFNMMNNVFDEFTHDINIINARLDLIESNLASLPGNSHLNSGTSNNAEPVQLEPQLQEQAVIEMVSQEPEPEQEVEFDEFRHDINIINARLDSIQSNLVSLSENSHSNSGTSNNAEPVQLEPQLREQARYRNGEPGAGA